MVTFPITQMVKGTLVKVRLKDDPLWSEGIVALVSPNGVSVALLLDGMVRCAGGYIGGALPLFYEAGKYTGLMGDEYEVVTITDQAMPAAR